MKFWPICLWKPRWERDRERERERGGGDRETERQREIMIHNVTMIPQLKTQLKRI